MTEIWKVRRSCGVIFFLFLFFFKLKKNSKEKRKKKERVFQPDPELSLAQVVDSGHTPEDRDGDKERTGWGVSCPDDDRGGLGCTGRHTVEKLPSHTHCERENEDERTDGERERHFGCVLCVLSLSFVGVLVLFCSCKKERTKNKAKNEKGDKGCFLTFSEMECFLMFFEVCWKKNREDLDEKNTKYSLFSEKKIIHSHEM